MRRPLIDDGYSLMSIRVSLGRISRKTETTILLIARRFSSIIGADKIIVLVAGRVAASGTSAELLAQNGWYLQAFKTGELSGDGDSMLDPFHDETPVG